MVICLERGVDLHTAQLMPLPLTVSCFSKIQIGFAFLVLAHPGSPGQRAVKRVSVCCLHASVQWCAVWDLVRETLDFSDDRVERATSLTTTSEWNNTVRTHVVTTTHHWPTHDRQTDRQTDSSNSHTRTCDRQTEGQTLNRTSVAQFTKYLMIHHKIILSLS